MKCKLTLTDMEKLTLEQLSVNHRHRDIRTRAAVLVHIGAGLSAPKAAQRLGVSMQSPYNWVRAWQTDGIAGLLGGHGGGRPRSLSEAMVATAVQAANTESLTLPQIAQRVEAVHGDCHAVSVRWAWRSSARALPSSATGCRLKKTQRGRLRDEAGHAREATASRP